MTKLKKMQLMNTPQAIILHFDYSELIYIYKQPLILNVASYSCDMLSDFSCLF